VEELDDGWVEGIGGVLGLGLGRGGGLKPWKVGCLLVDCSVDCLMMTLCSLSRISIQLGAVVDVRRAGVYILTCCLASLAGSCRAGKLDAILKIQTDMLRPPSLLFLRA